MVSLPRAWLAYLARCVLAAILILAAGSLTTSAAAQRASSVTPSDRLEFDIWKRRFLQPDGRVVDTGNGGVSHSEGQSYGLILAQAFDDRASFDLILHWTRLHLSRPYDRLLPWRYKPDSPNPVSDLNNATDGDLIYAWALLRAGKAWNEPHYTERGVDLASAILRLCVTTRDGRTMLLPAARGFSFQTHLVVNPSYYAFAAIRGLAEAVPDPRWQQLEYDGRRFLAESRFGRWYLPTDWEILPDQGRSKPADAWPPRYSWDAVRVPLQLVWAGVVEDPGPVYSAAGFWSAAHPTPFPAWTDVSNNSLAPYSGNSGVQAVARLSAAAILHKGSRDDLPPVASAKDYYAASLIMLSRLVWMEAIDRLPAPAPYANAPSTGSAPPPAAGTPVAAAPARGRLARIAAMLGYGGGDDTRGTAASADSRANLP